MDARSQRVSLFRRRRNKHVECRAHANDVFEFRAISMPTYPCAGRILSDKHLFELVAIKVRELCRACSQLK